MIKDLFSPRTVFGLQIDGTFLRAVQVSNPTGSPVVERMISRKIENPEEIGQELSDLLREEKIKPELLVTSLPTSSALVRQIDIILENSKKLDKIIKYQMEPYVPYPIDEMVVDFFATAPDEPVTVAGVRKERISKHLAILAQAGLNSDIVTLEDAALLFLYLNQHPEKTDAPIALVHLKAEETIVQVVRGNRLDFIRIVQGAYDPSALKETLALYRLKHPEETIKEILITGPAAADASAADRIEAMTGYKTSIWKPFESVKNGFGDIADDIQAESSVPLGLAVGLLNASPKKLDLRKEEFRLRTTFDLKNMVVYGLSAILLFLGLFTFDLFHRLSVRESRYEVLNKRIAGLLNETFPGTAPAIRGRELDQMKQAIASEKGRYLWLEDITDSGSVLDLLLGLTTLFAAHRDVKVDNLSVEGIRILLDGRASSFKTVDVLKGKLESAGFFKTIRLIGAKMDNQDKMVKFGFHLEKKK
ncbi:MAG: hypothetical protein C4530_23615 [Desulfobacteraceae bacterium]|nr:MAG: hypothetical protein C4530_23615 [Desulfobacteraceae bacterium]